MPKSRKDPKRKAPEEDLVVVARFGNSMEARLAQSKLKSEGIDAYLADENLGYLYADLNASFGGVKLNVKRSEADKAIRLLGIQK